MQKIIIFEENNSDNSSSFVWMNKNEGDNQLRVHRKANKIKVNLEEMNDTMHAKLNDLELLRKIIEEHQTNTPPPTSSINEDNDNKIGENTTTLIEKDVNREKMDIDNKNTNISNINYNNNYHNTETIISQKTFPEQGRMMMFTRNSAESVQRNERTPRIQLGISKINENCLFCFFLIITLF